MIACEHGELARSCDRCWAAQELERLEGENARLRAALRRAVVMVRRHGYGSDADELDAVLSSSEVSGDKHGA